MNKTQAAFEFSADNIPVNDQGNCYLWTFTFRDQVEVAVAKAAWGAFVVRMRMRANRGGSPFDGLRVFEMHRQHGLHIHVVTAAWWSVNEIRAIWQHARRVRVDISVEEDGQESICDYRKETVYGGRVHVKPIPANRIGYIAKYLSKEARPEALVRSRLWDRFGDYAGMVRVRDIVVESPWMDIYRTLSRCIEGWSRMRWHERRQATHNVDRGLPWHFGLGLAAP